MSVRANSNDEPGLFRQCRSAWLSSFVLARSTRPFYVANRAPVGVGITFPVGARFESLSSRPDSVQRVIDFVPLKTGGGLGLYASVCLVSSFAFARLDLSTPRIRAPCLRGRPDSVVAWY